MALNIKISSEYNILHPRDRELDLRSPVIMGVLNVTPDSFSDGGEFYGRDIALDHIGEMVRNGAKIIDIGGESTRPGAEPVTVDQELQRVIPVLQKAMEKYPDVFYSIDTTKYQVAREALKNGAHIINDISGLQKEPRLAELCAKYNAALILMHSQGDPQTMQDNPEYEDVVNDIFQFFQRQIKLARKKGAEQLILDPGIGFGKTLRHNLTLLAHLDSFLKLKHPLMIGVSRKSMIGKVLDNRPVDDRLIGTIAVHYDSMMHGARIIRVHDVKEANDSIKIYNAINSARS